MSCVDPCVYEVCLKISLVSPSLDITNRGLRTPSAGSSYETVECILATVWGTSGLAKPDRLPVFRPVAYPGTASHTHAARDGLVNSQKAVGTLDWMSRFGLGVKGANAGPTSPMGVAL